MSDAEPTIQQLFDLTGKVVLLTGATGHLGQSFARAMAEAGATVVACSRDADRAAKVAEALPGPGKHIGISLDQMDPAAAEAGFNEAVEKAGQVDILINNGNEALAKDWTDVNPEEFTRQLSNATGYFVLARLLRNHLVARGAQGNVLMIGSMYGVVGSYPDAYEGVAVASPVSYHTMKGGVIHMTRHLAVYWAQDGVRVNCLSPGPFPSENVNKTQVERLTTKCPMKRMGVAHELKGAALLLVSDAGSYITGQNILVDGGWTAW